jgi:hypothetical protein
MSTLMKKLSLLAAEDEDSEEYWRSLTPEQQRRRQIQKGEERDHESRLVNNPKASPAALHTLALKYHKSNSNNIYTQYLDGYHSNYITYRIAKNKNTHPNTLHLLTNKDDFTINELIKNPNTRIDTLHHIGVNHKNFRPVILKRLLHGPESVEDL